MKYSPTNGRTSSSSGNMAKKKKKVKAKTTKKADPNVEKEYFKEVTFICPVRGKITQKVKVKKLKTRDVGDTQLIKASDTNSEIEKEDDGLSIYSEEDLGKEDA